MGAGGPLIALLADVHGNLPALQAVVADARAAGASSFWNLGDAVGYGAFPDECVDLLREICEYSLLGNYDEKVLLFPDRKVKWSSSKHPLKFLAFRYASESLDRSSRDWLATLPHQLDLSVAGYRIRLVHATVLGNDHAVGPHTPAEYWERCQEALAAEEAPDLVLGGHIHRPFERAAGTRFVFAGAVGRPEDGDPRAHYTLLDLSGPDDIVIEHRRVAYDIEQAEATLRERGLPEAFVVMMRHGVDLKGALAIMEKD